jgi:hypothetical protein
MPSVVSRLALPVLIVAILGMSSGNAVAAPVLWTFDNGVVNGSFVYDATIEIFSEIAIASISGHSWDTGDLLSGLWSSPGRIVLSQGVEGGGLFDMFFFSALTDAGGTVTAGYINDICENASGCVSSDLSFFVTNLHEGILEIEGTAVPEPATLLLLGGGLLGAVVRRRRTVVV